MSQLTKGRKLAVLLAVAQYRRALRQGVAAAVEHEKLLSGLQCKTVVDVGANRGQFALVARRWFPQARIFAFEPLRQPAELFCRVFSGDSQVVLHPYALGAEAGVATIHVAKRDDCSSLLPSTTRQTAMFPDSAESHTEKVQMKQLDQVLSPDEIQRPSLLKLDVQGYELAVLKGGAQLLGCFDYVYSECAFCELYAGQPLADAVIRFLAERGFALGGIHNVGYAATGAAVQGDFLFRAAAVVAPSVVLAGQQGAQLSHSVSAQASGFR